MRFQFFVVAGVALLAAPCLADGTTFVGPSGWTADTAASADPAHPLMQWHLSGDTTTSLTYSRTTRTYEDSLAAIHANLVANKIKSSVDKDVPCQGKTAHVVEFYAGPDGHRIAINRMLVPTSDGVAAITYAHEDGTPFDPDVTKSEAAYCAAAPS